MDVLKGIKFAANLVGAKAEEHSPEICLGLGIVSMVGATVFACKGTIKAKKVIEDAKNDMEVIEEAEKEGITYDASTNEELSYSHEDAIKDRAIVTTRTAIELVKCYGPAGILTVGGITLLLKGHNILRKRNIALVAAYKSISEAYKNYQERIKAYLGETAAKNLKYGVKEDEVEVDTGKKNKDGTPKLKKEKKTIYEANPSEFSPYARFFEEGCKGWDPDPSYALTYLIKLQRWMNDRLKLERVVTLNDVYDELGIPRTKEGQVVGWSLLNGKGDGYIDFGIYNQAFQPNREFVDGYESSILLDFNVDGPVWDDYPGGVGFFAHKEA